MWKKSYGKIEEKPGMRLFKKVWCLWKPDCLSRHFDVTNHMVYLVSDAIKFAQDSCFGNFLNDFKLSHSCSKTRSNKWKKLLPLYGHISDLVWIKVAQMVSFYHLLYSIEIESCGFKTKSLGHFKGKLVNALEAKFLSNFTKYAQRVCFGELLNAFRTWSSG